MTQIVAATQNKNSAVDRSTERQREFRISCDLNVTIPVSRAALVTRWRRCRDRDRGERERANERNSCLPNRFVFAVASALRRVSWFDLGQDDLRM
jgi:hypothetical protein